MVNKCTFLGKDTSINGVVITNEIVVEGYIKGEIKASDTVYIKEGAVIEGSILTKRIIYEDGAQHDGLIRLNNENNPLKKIDEPTRLEEQIKDEKEREEPVLTRKKADEESISERLG